MQFVGKPKKNRQLAERKMVGVESNFIGPWSRARDRRAFSVPCLFFFLDLVSTQDVACLQARRHRSDEQRGPVPRCKKSFQTNANSTNKEEEEEEQEEEEEIKSPEHRNWSSLTEPLLHSILRRFDNLEDFVFFRGVCRGWRSAAAPCSASLPSQPPLILLARCPSYAEAFYDIARKRLYNFQPPWRLFSRFSIGYSHGFIITSTLPPFPKLLLWNLFTDARIRLPKAPEPFDRILLSSKLEF